jgi:dihydrodipicolinate synthase/N-acetylneuraminate lyase
MNRNDVDWRGYWAALPTPFQRDGDIGWHQLDMVVERFLDTGVHGLLANGSTGEWHSLSYDERVSTAARIISVVDDRVPVLVGCSSMCPRTSADLARQAQDDGASGVMLSPPPYLRPADDETEAFFRLVAADSELPMMIYNIPRRTGTSLSDPLLLKLASIPSVVALKNSTNDDAFFTTLGHVVGCLRVFGGNLMSDRGLDAMQTIGGDGYIGGWELLGRELPAYFEAVWSGDMKTARHLGRRERDLDEQLWNEGKQPRFGRSFQSQLKASLNLIGIPAGAPRFPLLLLDDPEKLAQLARVLAGFGLMVR